MFARDTIMQDDKLTKLSDQDFEEFLKELESYTPDQKRFIRTRLEYYQGISYAQEKVPLNELEDMKLTDSDSFMEGYNRTIELKNMRSL